MMISKSKFENVTSLSCWLLKVVYIARLRSDFSRKKETFGNFLNIYWEGLVLEILNNHIIEDKKLTFNKENITWKKLFWDTYLTSAKPLFFATWLFTRINVQYARNYKQADMDMKQCQVINHCLLFNEKEILFH